MKCFYSLLVLLGESPVSFTSKTVTVLTEKDPKKLREREREREREIKKDIGGVQSGLSGMQVIFCMTNELLCDELFFT